MIRYLFAFLLVISTAQAMVQPTVAAPADDWPHEIPAKAKAILEGAEEFELLSIDPIKPDKNAKDTFHGWKVLGKRNIEKADVRKELVAAFEKGVEEYKGGPAHCFNPRHGIRVASRTQTVDFVICFECFQVRVYQEGEKEQLFLVSHSPADVFNKVLSAAGITLPQAAAAPAAEAEERNAPKTNVYAYPEKLTETDKLVDGPSGDVIKITSPTALIWIDLAPDYRFAHPTEYVLISTKGTTVIKGHWWPVLNGKRLFQDGKDYKVEFPIKLMENTLPQAAAAPAAMVAGFEPISDLNLSKPTVNIDGPFPYLLREAKVGELIQLQIKYVPGVVFPESIHVVLSSRAFSTVGVYETGNEVVVLSVGKPVEGKAGFAYLSVFVKAMNELKSGEITVKVKMSDGKIKEVPFTFTIKK